MSLQTGEAVRSALIEELQLLEQQVRELTDDVTTEQFWKRPIEPGNSLGHLVLHLTGNLNHFVGAQLGGTNYTRDREREFNETNVPTKDEALGSLEDAVTMFRDVVSKLSDEDLTGAHPEPRLGSVLNALIHLVAHFALHRGQMSYIHRMLQTEKK